jgi:putative DNA primase/helicase
MPPEIEIDYTIEHGRPDTFEGLALGAEIPLPAEPEASAAEAPVIRIRPGRPDLGADAAAAALLATRLAIFRRGGTLVRPMMEVVEAAHDTTTVTAKFKDVCLATMSYILARAARFEQWDGRKEDWKRVDPPEKIGSMLLAGAGDWPVPTVAGIITTPTLRPDGSLLREPGYDQMTRLYLVDDPALRLPPIPETPSRQQALEALGRIADLLAEFPFVAPVDRAVALSGILTAVLRPGLSTAPLHAVSAHTPGTGKSYLVDIAAAFALGRRCPVIAAGKSEEETEKRIGALLLSGSPVISIDNVNGELGGDALCLLTERPVVKVRVLGKSDAPEIECRSAVFATGNNLTLVGDMTRRTVLCTLDAGVERPEMRQFVQKPFDVVSANRAAYIADALTVVRAYHAAGMPGRLPQLASYEQWSDTVRSALVWLGHEDPAKTMDTAREGDPETLAVREFYAHWQEVLTLNTGYTAVAIIAKANAMAPAYGDGDTGFEYPEFRDLLQRQAGEGRAISTRRLGKWLMRICGRVFDGFRLEVRADAHNGNRYMLVRANEAPRLPEAAE